MYGLENAVEELMRLASQGGEEDREKTASVSVCD